MDLCSFYGDMGAHSSQSSCNKVFANLPQYLGEHKTKSKFKVLPSMQVKLNQEDTANLFALLSMPINCRLTLGELLKVRPHLWADLARTL